MGYRKVGCLEQIWYVFKWLFKKKGSKNDG